MRILLAMLFCGLALPALGEATTRDSNTGLVTEKAEPKARAPKREPRSAKSAPPQRREAEKEESASAGGSSRGGTDLGIEAEKEEEGFRKKESKQP
jgi:hypothetical protein